MHASFRGTAHAIVEASVGTEKPDLEGSVARLHRHYGERLGNGWTQSLLISMSYGFAKIPQAHFELGSTLKSGSPGVFLGLSQITFGLAGPDFLAKSR